MMLTPDQQSAALLGRESRRSAGDYGPRLHRTGPTYTRPDTRSAWTRDFEGLCVAVQHMAERIVGRTIAEAA